MYINSYSFGFVALAHSNLLLFQEDMSNHKEDTLKNKSLVIIVQEKDVEFAVFMALPSLTV